MAAWFYVRNHQQVGPVELEQLQAMAQRGELGREDRVWREGMPDWVPAGSVPELRAGGPVNQIAAMSSAPASAVALAYQSQGAGTITASERAIDMLRQTGPWVRFMSVMMFIMAGLMVVVGLIMMLAGLAGVADPRPGSGSPPLALLGFIYIPLGLIYIAPAVFLGRYASRSKKTVLGRQPSDLEAALQAQKSFWKFLGIMTIIILCVYALIIAGAVVVGVVRAMHGMPR